MRNFLLFAILFIVVSCSDNSEEITIIKDNDSISVEAELYLNKVLNIMENNSINKYKIDWVSFKKETIKIAGNAQQTYQTYNAIRHAISLLGDNHSFFIEPQNTSQLCGFLQESDLPLSTNNKTTNELYGTLLKPNIGYVRIPAFSGSEEVTNLFAAEIQSLIKSIDNSNVKGWIVDLRKNTGGDMWPMIAGVGPILGNGLIGKFVDPDNDVYCWYYEDGKSKNDDYIISEVKDFYTLINPIPYVAVLTDGLTASSGEAIAISFIGRPNTRSFGNYTYGVSTANASFNLSDGALLVLTVSTMADRNGKLYGNKIKPDEIILTDPPTIDDEVVKTAISWLENNI